MGVTGLWKLVASARETTTFAHLADQGFRDSPGRRGYRLGIDASLWLFHARTMTGSMDIDQVGPNAALRTLFYRLLSLLREGLLPLFVFDGKGGPAHKRGKSGANKGRYDHLANQFRECCDILGVPYLTAEGEAEAELAELGSRGEIDGCLSDDSDTLVFGAPVVVRNLSAGLSGHSFKEGKEGDGAGAEGYGKHSLAIYKSTRVQETTELDRPALILIALISGGDYLPEGIPGAGPTTTLALAKLGFGRKLLDGLAACGDSAAKADAFLASWREEIASELETNKRGMLSRRQKVLAGTVRAQTSFPDLQTVRDYDAPVVSTDRRRIDWHGEPDVARLVGWCSDTFYFPVEEIVDRLRNLYWKALAMRHLRLAALAADRALPRELAASPLHTETLLVAVHDQKTSEATTFVPAYRVELDPVPLLAMIVPHLPNPDPHAVAEDDPRRQGLEGTSQGKKAKLKTMDKSGRTSVSHWVGVEWVEAASAGRELVEAWRDGRDAKERKKAEAEERRRAKAEGRATSASVSPPKSPRKVIQPRAKAPVAPRAPPSDSDDDEPVAPSRRTQLAPPLFATQPKPSRAHTPTPPPTVLPDIACLSRPRHGSPRKSPPARSRNTRTVVLSLSSDSDDDLPERLEWPPRAGSLKPPSPGRAEREPSPLLAKAAKAASLPPKLASKPSSKGKENDVRRSKSPAVLVMGKGGAGKAAKAVAADKWASVEVLDLTSD